MNEPAYVDTWKAIAAIMGRSERWCRYMSARADDPLPVFKVGGLVRLDASDLAAWYQRQKARRPSMPAEIVRALNLSGVPR